MGGCPATVGILPGGCPAPQGGRTRSLKKRVEGLEKGQREALLQGQSGGVKPFTARNITIGGFSSTTFEAIFGKSTKTQKTFRKFDVDLLISAEITDKLKFFTDLGATHQVDFNNQNAPFRSFDAFETRFTLDIASTEYRFYDSLVLSFGRMLTPFGIINVERYEPLLLSIRRPAALRLFSSRVQGLQLSGSISQGSHRIGYSGYVSSFSNDTQSVGGGGRLFWTFPGEQVTLGISNETAQRDGMTFGALGGDLKVKWGEFVLRSEYIRRINKGAAAGTGYYVQPSYGFFDGRWILFGQVDFLDDTLGTRKVDADQNPKTPDVADPIKQFVYTGGINYLPWPFLRTRLEFNAHDYRSATLDLGNRDYYSTELSATVSF